MKTLEVCQEYPSKYYLQLETFIKQGIDSIADENVEPTVFSPKKSFSIRMFKYGAWMTELFMKQGERSRWHALLSPIVIFFIIIAFISLIKHLLLAQVLGLLVLVYFILFTTVQVMYKMKSIYDLLSFLVLFVQYGMYGVNIFPIHIGILKYHIWKNIMWDNNGD